MVGRTLVATLALSLISASAFAQNYGGYVPWHGGGFAPYMEGPTVQPQDQPIMVYNLAPVMGQEAFDRVQYENRWSDLQVMLSRARDDFKISSDYLAARDDYESAQSNYDAAVEAVLSRVHEDRDYRKLAEKRTQEQVILDSTAVGTGVHNVIAVQSLHDGAMMTLIEAKALNDDSTVSDARVRMVSAHRALWLKEKLFESQLYHKPDVVAARQQMETARAQLAGAEGTLRGALISYYGY